MPGAKAADTAEQLDDEQNPQPNGDQPAAEPAAEPADAGKTPVPEERSSAARPEGTDGDQPTPDGDDDVLEENDPLTKLRKQFVAGEKPAAKAEPKPSTPEPGKQPAEAKKPEQPKAASADEQTRVEDDQVLADLPAEEWAKLSHEGKRRFLTARKEIVNVRKERDELRTREKAAADREKAAKQQAENVERFVRANGLANEEYDFGVRLMGAIKRGDPAAIPHVENTLRQLYEATGRKPPEPAAPAAPPEIEPIKGKLPDELIELVELHGIPEEDVRLLAAVRVQRAQRKAQPAPAAAPAPAPAPAAPPQPATRQPQRDPAEVAVDTAIYSYLEAQGIPHDQVVDYVATKLAPNFPKTGPIPVSARLAAVVKAHQQLVGSTKPSPTAPTAKPPSNQPISGRVGAAGGGRKPSTADPMEALKSRWVR